MPTIPTVFRPIRANDVQRRSFKTYKNYSLTNTGYSESGAQYQEAMYTGLRVDVNDPAASYPENADGTNRHIYWSAIDHRYYRYPYDPARTAELSNRSKVEKLLFTSASIVTVPYMDVGERIKPGSVTITATPVGETITLTDDGYGNLRDLSIDSSSFASASRNVFYLSFNETFRDFDYKTGTYVTGSIKYVLNGQDKNAEIVNVTVTDGVVISGSTNGMDDAPIGLAGYFDGGNNEAKSYIRIPHDDTFNRFNKCDDWTISFWFTADDGLTQGGTILSKLGVGKRTVFNRTKNTLEIEDIQIPSSLFGTSVESAASYPTTKFPFSIGYTQTGGSMKIAFVQSDGSSVKSLATNTIPVSAAKKTFHVAVRNSNSVIKIFIDGIDKSASNDYTGLDNVNNNADILIGALTKDYDFNDNFTKRIAEIRMYDYAVSDTGITSLANRADNPSCLQTNVVGNVFYRNGQIVVSSPLPKYNSGSGFFSNTWQIDYKGQHTIYENEVMVRVPAGELNVSLNPSSTYRPATGIDNSCNTNGSAENNGPGEYRKAMFISGSAFPYVTTIGLYNDAAEMVAVGKLATPVQKRDDVDMNFVVRWDH